MINITNEHVVFSFFEGRRLSNHTNTLVTDGRRLLHYNGGDRILVAYRLAQGRVWILNARPMGYSETIIRVTRLVIRQAINTRLEFRVSSSVQNFCKHCGMFDDDHADNQKCMFDTTTFKPYPLEELT